MSYAAIQQLIADKIVMDHLDLFSSTEVDLINQSILISNRSQDNDITVYSELPLAAAILVALLLGLVILGTTVGNLVVIVAILTDRHLQRPQNMLIISLAVADLTVGVGVMPLSAIYEVSGRQWLLGAFICEVWTFLDVSACSASILNLVAIALDRYWSVTDIHYSQQRDRRKICALIAVVWVISILISSLPIFGWKDSDYNTRIQNRVCLMSQDMSYQLVSTITAFYAPLVIIISLYSCIYRAAKARIRKRSVTPASTEPPSPLPDQSQRNILRVDQSFQSSTGFNSSFNYSSVIASNAAMLTIGRAASIAALLCDERAQEEFFRKYSLPVDSRKDSQQNTLTFGGIEKLKKLEDSRRRLLSPKLAKWRRRMSVEARRERKAFHTLAIITGSFIVCWLPFFMVALCRIVVSSLQLNEYVDALVLWLGWSNSLINPIIYTVFSPDFRKAFRKLLLNAVPFYRNRDRRRNSSGASSTGPGFSSRLLPKMLVMEASTVAGMGRL